VPEGFAEGCERRDERFYNRIDEGTTSRSAKPTPNRCGNYIIGNKEYGGSLDESTADKAENADNHRGKIPPKTRINTIETGEKIHLYYPQNNFKIFPIGPKIHPMHVSTADPQAIARVGQMTKMSCSKTCAVIPRI